MAYPLMSSGFVIGSLALENRLVMAPMSTSLGGIDGSVTPENIAFYRERVLGGFGLIIVEFTCVDPATGRTEERQLSLDSRRNLDGHKQLADCLHDAGGKALIQLQHGGRFSPAHLLPGGVTKGPSPVASRKDPNKIVVQPFASDEVEALVEAFARSARLAAEAGYDGIELHGAHGYLLSQFLSPVSNQRDDQWGGDFERRLAFPLTVLRAIRAEIGALPLCFRFSADEFMPNGLSIDDNVRIAPRLVEAGADMLHVSTGRGPESFDKVMEPISAAEGWRLPYARRIREAAGVPVIGVGQIRWPETAEAALERGDCDLVALGRPSLADPHWPRKAISGQRDSIRPCTSCNWCISGAHPHVSCAENPRAGHELDPMLAIADADRPRAAVIGAGPAGLAAALMLDQAGVETHLFETRAILGGGLAACAAPPGKDKFLWYLDYLGRQVEASGIHLHLGSKTQAADVIAISPAFAVVATGTQSIDSDIPGHGLHFVCEAFDLLIGDAPLIARPGETAIVYGGGETGCETAEYLAERGIDVKLVTRSPIAKLARSAEMVYRTGLLQRLTSAANIEILAEAHIVAIGPGSASVRDGAGMEITIQASQLLMAQGRSINQGLAAVLDAAGIRCHIVGDSRQIGRVGDAVHASYEAVRSIIASHNPSSSLAC